MSTTLDDLRAAVARNTNQTQSAIVLIQGLSSRIRAAADSGDQATMRELADELDRTDVALAQAIQAGTPGQTTGGGGGAGVSTIGRADTAVQTEAGQADEGSSTANAGMSTDPATRTSAASGAAAPGTVSSSGTVQGSGTGPEA